MDGKLKDTDGACHLLILSKPATLIYALSVVLETKDIRQKLRELPGAIELAISGKESSVPSAIARDAQILPSDQHPDKKGLSFREGQARLLHDLASIELQAMELGLRTLREYQEAPMGFREELAAITLSEGEHLKMALDGLESLGYSWGQWPVHTALWEATRPEDSLLDRILIVHRYLEGSGLDAGETLLRRLYGILENPILPILKKIFDDEVGHVDFGSRWYREICLREKIDAATDFGLRMERLRYQIPKRIEPIAVEKRRQAGFTENEIFFLQDFRESMVKFKKKS